MYRLCTAFDCDAPSLRHRVHPIDNFIASPLVTFFLSPLGASDCAVCVKDFAPGIAYSCRECSGDTTRSAVGLAVAVGLALLTFAGVLLYNLGKVSHDGAEVGIEMDQRLWQKKIWSCQASMVNMLPVRAIKITVTVWQIISQVQCTTVGLHRKQLRNISTLTQGCFSVLPYTMVAYRYLLLL